LVHIANGGVCWSLVQSRHHSLTEVEGAEAIAMDPGHQSFHRESTREWLSHCDHS